MLSAQFTQLWPVINFSDNECGPGYLRVPIEDYVSPSVQIDFGANYTMIRDLFR